MATVGESPIQAVMRTVSREFIDDLMKDLDRKEVKKAARRRRKKDGHKHETIESVGEIYSPPRMAAMAEKLGMKGSWSLDLETKNDMGVC